MTYEELKEWQRRLDLSQVEAAKRTNTPIQTYRHYLAGRRKIPSNFDLLCRYVEVYGPLEKENE